jgi:hypothetical protein
MGGLCHQKEKEEEEREGNNETLLTGERGINE